ncbi:MAG: polysaccharide deacetylase family protein [Desulfobacteraceae bacterium]|jgi:peptidoglycan/xylan/chitin deacetylase (PgdA/CDA1 family)
MQENSKRLPTWPLLQSSLEHIRKPRRWPAILEKGIGAFKKPPERYAPGVYIFAYHTVVDESHAAEWERLFNKGWVSKRHFEEHIAFLTRHMTALPLSEVPRVFESGAPDRPYFTITFDDGFSDILENAAPILERYGIQPTVFVNGAFAGGRVFYRVLASVLVAKGHAEALAGELKKRIPSVAWTTEPKELFNQTKNHYHPYRMEEATEAAYRSFLGEPEALGVHLGPEALRKLAAIGWEIGNHTHDHVLLGTLDFEQIHTAISKNHDYLVQQGLSPIPWLAYPVGRARDVNDSVRAWLEKNKTIQGLFCNGGVNLKRTRTQWLRLFAGNGDVSVIRKSIEVETRRTRKALALAESGL